MHAARLVVGASVLTASLVHAWLLAAAGRSMLPPLIGLVLGLAARAVLGPARAPLLALAVAPVWSVIGTVWYAGAPPLEPVWPWMAFLGAVVAWPAGGSWHSTGAWRLAIVAWSLGVALTWPIVALRELDFTTAAITAVTVNGPTAGTPAATASFAMLMAVAQLTGLLLADWYAGRQDADRRRVWWTLLPGMLVTGGVAVWQQLVDPAFLGSEPWITLRRGAGTFLDANASGALLALLGPALAAHLAVAHGASTRLLPYVKSGVVVTAIAGVVATGSRTALAAVLFALLTRVLADRRQAAWAGFAVVAVAIALLAGRSSFETDRGQAVGRLAGTLSRVLDRGPDEVWAVVRDRDGYGTAARAMLAEYPWFGIGTGTFTAIVGSYGRTAAGAPLPADNAQNWWRQTATEAGLFGGLPALSASALLGLAAVQLLRRRQAAAAAVAAPIAGLGLMALVSTPTAHPILQVVTALVAAATAAVAAADRDRGTERTRRDRFETRGAVAVVWVFAAACAAGTAVTSWRDLRPPYRAADFHFAYNYGTTDIVTTPYGEGRWMSTRAVAVIPPTQSRTLITQVVAPHDDLAAHPVAIWISDRHRIICRGRVSDHTPLVCRVPVPLDEWPMLQVEVERLWTAVDGVPRAAVVSARFE